MYYLGRPINYLYSKTNEKKLFVKIKIVLFENNAK